MKIPMGQALAYAIGVLVLFPLLLYGVNKIFFSGREVTDRQISQYINNSVKIKDIPKNNHLSFEEERKDKRFVEIFLVVLYSYKKLILKSMR